MQMDQDLSQDQDPTLSQDQESQETTTAEEITAGLPRLPPSPRRQKLQDPNLNQGQTLRDEPTRNPFSSTAPTDPKPVEPTPPPKQRELADPKDVAEALSDGVEIGLVLVGAGASRVHARVSGRDHRELEAEGRWIADENERERISKATGRIIKRHAGDIDGVSADAIDSAVIASTLLHLGLRSTIGAPKERTNP